MVSNTIARTAGTKTRVNRSAKRWEGDCRDYASSTISITGERVESFSGLVTIMRIVLLPFTGDRRLINRAVFLFDISVDRQALAGSDDHDHPFFELVHGDITFRVVHDRPHGVESSGEIGGAIEGKGGRAGHIYQKLPEGACPKKDAGENGEDTRIVVNAEFRRRTLQNEVRKLSPLVVFERPGQTVNTGVSFIRHIRKEHLQVKASFLCRFRITHAYKLQVKGGLRVKGLLPLSDKCTREIDSQEEPASAK